MWPKFQLKTIFVFSFVFLCLALSGQDVVTINKNGGDINFDGIPDEPFWQLAQDFELVMHSPNYGTTPTEKSIVYISYDNNFLWVSAMLKYADPSNIVSTSKKRDEESKNPDSFGILLDTYDDNENALAFFTMPAGQRIDYAVSNDAQSASVRFGTTNINYSWNTFWDVKTARTEEGWSVEMRIPFSSLRFQVENGKVQMGLLINRSISHCNEMDTYPEVDPKHGRTAPNKPSLAKTIVLTDIEESKPVYFSPYVITGIDKINELNETGTEEYIGSNEKTLNGGLDLKYSITSNLTMDLTVNTDFAQVEADDERVNLTRYSLFFPEKRMFFQERASIFNFSLGGPSQLFYSRRIGIDNQGTPVPILGGARLTGRVGKWDMGFMDMQTQSNENVSSENFGVLRFRRQVINDNSYIGAIMTSRISQEMNNEYSYGIDGIFRVFGDDYVEVNVAQTTDPDGNNFTGSLNSTFYNLKWERRSQEGFAYDLSYSYSGKYFDPKMGFMSKYGIKGGRYTVQYGWIPGADSKLFSYNIDFSYSRTLRVVDNEIESGMFGPGFSFNTKKGWFWKIDLNYNIQGVDREFELSDGVYVPVDTYKYYSARANIYSPTSKIFSTKLSLGAGEFYDGNNFTVTAEPVLNLSASIQFSGYYNFNHVVFPSRNQEMNSHVARVKFLYMYNTKLSLSSFIQYNSVNSITLANFRLRYNPKEGNDLYLVYNETRPTSGYFNDSISKVSFLARTIQIKYVHTLRL